MLGTRAKVVAGGALASLGLVVLTAGSLFAQGPAPTQVPGGAPDHEPMHRMMDAMHGEGTSQRMHDAMGKEGEQILEQCAGMMAMMQTRDNGMMGDGMMGGARRGDGRDRGMSGGRMDRSAINTIDASTATAYNSGD